MSLYNLKYLKLFLFSSTYQDKYSDIGKEENNLHMLLEICSLIQICFD